MPRKKPGKLGCDYKGPANWPAADPSSPEGRRIIERAKVEAAAIRARKAIL